MSILASEALKMGIVKAIREGLVELKDERSGRTDVINNSFPQLRLDRIANTLIEKFRFEDDFKYAVLRRGSYDILLLYNCKEKVLYSLFSHKRFSDLIKTRCDGSMHYLKALVDLNGDVETRRIQIVIDEELFDENEDKKELILNKVISLLGDDEPERYISICHSIQGYRLCGVTATLTSKYLEVIEEQDWSAYIDIDYSEVEYENYSESDDGIHIEVKSDIINVAETIDDISIPVKHIINNTNV